MIMIFSGEKNICLAFCGHCAMIRVFVDVAAMDGADLFKKNCLQSEKE